MPSWLSHFGCDIQSHGLLEYYSVMLAVDTCCHGNYFMDCLKDKTIEVKIQEKFRVYNYSLINPTSLISKLSVKRHPNPKQKRKHSLCWPAFCPQMTGIDCPGLVLCRRVMSETISGRL